MSDSLYSVSNNCYSNEYSDLSTASISVACNSSVSLLSYDDTNSFSNGTYLHDPVNNHASDEIDSYSIDSFQRYLAYVNKNPIATSTPRETSNSYSKDTLHRASTNATPHITHDNTYTYSNAEYLQYPINTFHRSPINSPVLYDRIETCRNDTYREYPGQPIKNRKYLADYDPPLAPSQHGEISSYSNDPNGGYPFHYVSNTTTKWNALNDESITYDKIHTKIACRACPIRRLNKSPTMKRRRRKVVAQSLILEYGYSKSPQCNGFSDSGMRCNGKNQVHDSDSSNSDHNTFPAVRVPRRKPKSLRKNVPIQHQGSNQVPAHTEESENLHKVQELETDKKNLLLQASVLADQVDAQADKIVELERLLQQKKEELSRLEQNLHQEIISRSTMENNKLELMTELANLRLRLTAAERDRKESDDKCRKLEHQLTVVLTNLSDKESEHSALKDKLLLNESRFSPNESLDIEKLKSALDSVLIATDKDQKLEDLQSSLSKYKKLHDMILSSHTHLRKTSSSGSDSHIFHNDSILCSSNHNSLKKNSSTCNSIHSSHVSQSLSSMSSLPPYHERIEKTHVSLMSASSNSSSLHKSSSVENISKSTVPIFPTKSQYGTMPRQSGPQVLQHLQAQLQEHEIPQNNGTLSNGNSASVTPVHEKASISSSKICRNSSGSSNKSSAVSFADECITIPVERHNADYSPDGCTVSQPFFMKSDRDKNKGLLKFFSKQDLFKRWKRTGSQNIEGDFKRGGIRATAGPRLGWSHDIKIDPDIPFDHWNTDMIVDWFHKLNLSMYVSDCKRWKCNGETLIKASSHDIEKELNIKHPLHRKKLLLAIKSMNNNFLNLPTSINKIDSDWVFRWLDDVGLPQYKDAFAEALIDGRMLHTLTVDDLLFLKVTSQLHHISIKCGIQVLREKGFDPHCLVRRSLPDENKMYTPESVALWTNHRVMEWLRTVDLAEYAPNLRGSGVHGALIVYESKFNTNLFATLLNIPPTKTLLRRHLATHFRHIVGDELMQIKREKETEIPLSPSVKIKIVKKNQFALKKKRKSELDNDDYICPMDIPVCQEHGNISKLSDGDKLVVRRNSDPSPHERNMNLQDDDVERIGVVSKEIATLTTLLQEEDLNSIPSTIV